MASWQTITKLLGGGTVGLVVLFSLLFTLTGMEYTHSGDIYCEDTCESYINITTSYWRVCFEETSPDQNLYIPRTYSLFKTTAEDANYPTLYKKSTYGRTLWVNLNNIDSIISTNPSINVEWLVPTYGGKWRPLKSGDCWDRGKVNKIKLVGEKSTSQTVKWNFVLGDEISIDPLWKGYSVTCDKEYKLLESAESNKAILRNHYEEDGECKSIEELEDLTPLLDSGDLILNYDYDGVHKINLNSFNLTHIEFDLEFYNSSLKEYASEVIDGKMNTKFKVYKNKTSLEREVDVEIKEKEKLKYVYEGNPIGKTFKFGLNSSEVTITSNNTGKTYEDTFLSGYNEEQGYNYGGYDSMELYELDDRNNTLFVKYNNLYDILGGEDLTNVTWVLRTHNNGASNIMDNLTIWEFLSNWTEGDLNGSAGAPNWTTNFDGTTYTHWTPEDIESYGGLLLAEKPNYPSANNEWFQINLDADNFEHLVNNPGTVFGWAGYDHDSSNLTFFIDTIEQFGAEHYIIVEYATYNDVVIDSPQNTTYYVNYYDLNVTSEDTIDTWWYSNDSGQNNVTFTPNITFLNVPYGGYSITVWNNESTNQVNSSSVDFLLIEPDTNLTLNGLAQNIDAELGTLINISSQIVVDQNLTLDIDHPKYGINYINTFNETNLTLDIDYFRRDELNDSSSRTNLTYASSGYNDIGIQGHQYDDIINISINLTGWENSGDYPSNVKVYINGNLSNSIGTLFETGETILNSFSDGDSEKNVTLSGGSTSLAGYLRIPAGITVDEANLTLSGLSTGVLDQQYDVGEFLVLDGTSDIQCGNKSYDYVVLENGATLEVCDYDGSNETTGQLFLNVTHNITIDATSRIYGSYAGYRGGDADGVSPSDGEGPGAGDCCDGGGGDCGSSEPGGGGAGYTSGGGQGGAECNGDLGGLAGSMYGSNSSREWNRGSGGGSGADPYGGDGGDGGAGLRIISPLINISGSIDMCGGGGYAEQIPSKGAGGGASGGTILLESNELFLHGNLNVSGGEGGPKGSSWGTGGGGSGGMVKLFFTNLIDTGLSYNLSGGSATESTYGGGDPGGDGVYYINQRGNYTYDPWLEIGDVDGTREWEWIDGHFKDAVNTTKDLKTAIDTYLASCTADDEGYCLVPVYLYSSSNGIIEVSDISISYTFNVNPIDLDEDLVRDFLGNSTNETDIPITISSDSAGIIEVYDIRYDYAGGNDTIEIVVQDLNNMVRTSYNVTYFYSKWDYAFPDYIDYLEFIPRTSTSDNVTPYGQTDSRAILNITFQNYGGRDMHFSYYLNESEKEDCVNITISTDKFKSNGSLIDNQTWTNISIDNTYTSKIDLWIWADFECNYTSWSLWEPLWEFRGCCDDCICGEEVV